MIPCNGPQPIDRPSDATLIAWLALARLDGVGPHAAARLLRLFGGVHGVVTAGLAGEWPPLPHLRDLKGVPNSLQASLDGAQSELARGRRLGATAIAFGDPRYPASWSLEHGWPIALWVRGDWLLEYASPSPLCLAVVGTRRASQPALRFAAALAEKAAMAGAHVVSGLALGVDGAAHQGALGAAQAGGLGRTVAVLAGGVDRPGPTTHRPLAREILDAGGALVSEAAVGATPFPGSFPMRNRVIAGLASAVAVIEAGGTSGALHTVRAALDHNLEVGVAPARPWDAHASGSLAMLRDGAAPLIHPDDGWMLLPAEVRSQLTPPPVGPTNELGRSIVRVLQSVAPGHPGVNLDELHLAVGGAIGSLIAAVEIALLDGWLQRGPSDRLKLVATDGRSHGALEP